MLTRSKHSNYSILILLGIFAGAAFTHALTRPAPDVSGRGPGDLLLWRSELYPSDWNPRALGDFATDKIIQDFSYAGYHSGERPLPSPEGPRFDVTASPFNADNSGARDATAAIQAAIDAASAAGGGVVFLPAGTYHLSLSEDAREALHITTDGVILRGEGPDRTFLLNTRTEMRSRVVIRIAGDGGRGDFFNRPSARTAITQDLMRPTRVIPVAATDRFRPGDFVTIHHELTDAWIEEHDEPSWLTDRGRPRAPAYLRQITAVDHAAKTLTVDIPIRYFLRLRDNPMVFRLAAPPLREVGIEHLAIGNREHPGRQWGEDDHRNEGTPAHDVHASFFVAFERVRDSWARNIHSFSPEGNRSGAHFLSNGILIHQSSRLTLADVHLARPQYGGGGGNGYLFRLQHANDCLLIRCRATFSRHGFLFSHAGTNGVVLHDCVDDQTGRATGHTGSYRTAGSSSDHHMQFSHSNLIDQSTANDSWFEARYRPHPRSAAVRHGVTAAHSVFWNITGRGSPAQAVVVTEQARYGYVIGTSGTRFRVERPNGRPSATDPADHVEGVGRGETLEPQSLFLDQLARRLGHTENLP
ncbi:MAG: hypothetical protein JJT96_17800 [Opitutales bacterium]|nr:hypothetical protein [Opitutales bacterium]